MVSCWASGEGASILNVHQRPSRVSTLQIMPCTAYGCHDYVMISTTGIEKFERK